MIKKYQDLVSYFLKHSFQEIPIISENSFNQVVNKKKLLKFIQQEGLLEEKVDDKFHTILTFLKEEEINNYFEKILSTKHKKIPVIFFDNFIEVKVILIEKFIEEYKEIKNFSFGDFLLFYEEEHFPIFIVNNQEKIIFKNEKFLKIEKKFFSKKNGKAKEKVITDFLITSKKSKKKVFFYKKKLANQIFYFKLQKLAIQNSLVFQFTFITNK